MLHFLPSLPMAHGRIPRSEVMRRTEVGREKGTETITLPQDGRKNLDGESLESILVKMIKCLEEFSSCFRVRTAFLMTFLLDVSMHI